MKKKLVLFLAILSVLACIFAISITAAENDFGTVETFTGISEKSTFGADGTASGYTSRVVLFDGTNYHTYPSYYIFPNSNSPTALTFDEINAAVKESGETYQYTSSSVIRVEVPQNIIKVNKCFNNNKSLVYVYFPATLTLFTQNGFTGCSALEYVNVPRDCEGVAQYCIDGCSSLKVFDMSEAKSFKYTSHHNFSGVKLTELVFPDGFESFSGISSSTIKYIAFPDTTTSVGVMQCSSLEEVVLPANLSSLGNKTFDYCSSLKKVTIPKSLQSIVPAGQSNPTFFGTSTSNLKEIIYTGSPNDPIVATIKASVPKATITYSNHCEVYYGGEHGEYKALNGCQFGCERKCGVYTFLENPVHENVKTVTYGGESTVDYTKTIVVIVACKNCGTEELNKEINALIECKGYSKAIEGIGFVQSFLTDDEAIASYKQYVNENFDYGIVAAIGTTTPIVENEGKLEVASGSVLVASMTYTQYTKLEIKIVDIPSDEVDTPVVLCAYFFDGSVYYVDDGAMLTEVTGKSYSELA